jgi:N-acetylmuramoyl-L-alanine amidase
MRHLVIAAAMLCGVMATAQAQDLTALARVDGQASAIKDGWFGKTTLTLHLSQGVPFRVFHMDDPARLVVDFREADWTGVAPDDLLTHPGQITAVRFGPFRPGWSRLVMDLGEPMLPETIGMPVDPNTGRATLQIDLRRAAAVEFTSTAGAPVGRHWAVDLAQPQVAPKSDDRFVIVIDPGHGGVDPGAVRDGIREKDIMLTMARGLAETLARTGEADVYLTRDTDVFVSLPARVGMAHRAQADLFISLHADALGQGQGQAHGATVYTLSDDASDAASEQLAAQHNRSDIIAGVDLSRADDEIANVLIDLARLETNPRNDALAEALLDAIEAAGKPLAKTRRREAGFSVLKSADIPSVLLEVGFLSSPRDLANLRDPIWRDNMVKALAGAILQWRADDLAQKPLVRQ